MSNDKKFFPNGLFFKEKHPNAPDFVKGQISIKVDDFKAYLSKVNGEWLNIDLKVSKDGKPYAEVNTFKSEKQQPGRPKQTEVPDDFDDIDDSLPF